MRRKILPFVLGGALSIAAVAPAAASNHQTVNQDAVQRALIGVIVQAAVRDVVEVEINDSLNNLLRDADIDVNVLNDSLNNVLRNVNVDISDIDIDVLSGGDIILTVEDGVVTLP